MENENNIELTEGVDADAQETEGKIFGIYKNGTRQFKKLSA